MTLWWKTSPNCKVALFWSELCCKIEIGYLLTDGVHWEDPAVLKCARNEWGCHLSLGFKGSCRLHHHGEIKSSNKYSWQICHMLFYRLGPGFIWHPAGTQTSHNFSNQAWPFHGIGQLFPCFFAWSSAMRAMGTRNPRGNTLRWHRITRSGQDRIAGFSKGPVFLLFLFLLEHTNFTFYISRWFYLIAGITNNYQTKVLSKRSLCDRHDTFWNLISLITQSYLFNDISTKSVRVEIIFWIYMVNVCALLLGHIQFIWCAIAGRFGVV